VRDDLAGTSFEKLKRSCRKNGIAFTVENGKIKPEDGSEIDFLELLDRRRYGVDLAGEQELYVAPNRRAVVRRGP
jgi:hypothetical protein